MKKLFALFFAATIISSINLAAQDLNEVLENHFEVIGLENVLDTETMVMKGKATQQGMEFPMTLFQKRPGKVRMEAEIQGTKLIQAFDGENGWAIMPWTGSMEPQDMGEEQVKSMKQMADMEGDLYNWEEKGYIVELVGEEEMEGTPVYKIKLEKEDGDVFHYYLDADNYVVLKTDAKVMVQGAEVESSSYFSNFKPVEGMIVPFSIENRVNDQVQLQITIDEYQINTDIEDTMFSKPESTETDSE